MGYRQMSDRYDASGTAEGQHQPGSKNRVLANKPGITDPQDMNNLELELLEQLMFALLDEVTEDQPLTVADICEWHRRWLGNVYRWAGSLRSVNIGKDDFQFAAAMQLPSLLEQLDRNYLDIHTPCKGFDDDRLIEALAVVHVEFVLIHPFREGNGRMARLIAIIMALQAGRPALNFSCFDSNKPFYFSAIQTGLSEYGPMKTLFRQALQESGKYV